MMGQFAFHGLLYKSLRQFLENAILADQVLGVLVIL